MRYSTKGVAAAVMLAGLLALGGEARGQIPLVTDVTNLSGFGAPLLAIINEVAHGNTANFALFADGQIDFTEVEALPTVGPIFNSRSCGGCHFQPALGGSGSFINEVRVRNNTAGGPVHIFANDNILRAGPQNQGGVTIFPSGLEATPLGCQITHPSCKKSLCQQEEATRTTFSTTLPICDPTSSAFNRGKNCTAERQSTPLFGFGFIEAVADSTFTAIANSQPLSIRGTVKTVSELGATRVGRFGWKDDVATLRGFAGDAYLNEMGITSPDFPTERSQCARNVTQFGVLLDAADEPEDTDTGRRARRHRSLRRLHAHARSTAAPGTELRRAGGSLVVQPDRLRGMPSRERDHLVEPRRVHPEDHGRTRGGQREPERVPRQPDVPSLLRLPAARHGIAG